MSPVEPGSPKGNKQARGSRVMSSIMTRTVRAHAHGSPEPSGASRLLRTGPSEFLSSKSAVMCSVVGRSLCLVHVLDLQVQASGVFRSMSAGMHFSRIHRVKVAQ